MRGACVADAQDREACAALQKDGKALLLEAEKAQDARAAVRAADLFARAGRLCPEDPENPFWQGLAFVIAKDADRAQASLVWLDRALSRRAADLNRPDSEANNDLRLHYLRGLLHFTFDNRPDLAIEEMKLVAARNPAFMTGPVLNVRFWSHVALANQFAHAKRYDEAIRETRLAEALARGDVTRRDKALRNRGQIYRIADRWLESQAVWEDLLQRYPEDAILRYALASTVADQLKFEEACVQWREVLRLARKPGTFDAREADQLMDAPMRYGVCLILAGKHDEGRSQLLEYSKAHPEDARGWFHLGEAAMETFDEPDKAVVWLEKARALDPVCERTLRMLRTLYTTGPHPDPETAKALQATLESETDKAARKKEMERRRRVRPDGLTGCE